VRIADDKFRVFISHKHEDHALAEAVQVALEGLEPELIDCFVSGVDIPAGVDWRREIRSALAKSHALMLLFTAPSNNWDWCLYETGLYTRFDENDVHAVFCLFSPGGASPSPLADLQGVPAEFTKVRAFLDTLCRKTWEVSDDWHRGALAPDITKRKVDEAAQAITDAFHRSGSASTYYPCHRLVLSLAESDKIKRGIPETARVMVGPNDTSGYTLSLFDLAGGEPATRTWGDLLQAVGGTEAEWRRELDARFLMALDEQLFPPIEATMRAGGTSRSQQRLYRPILYSIVRGPTVAPGPDPAEVMGRPRSVTIVFEPLDGTGND
jgi:hypothetical protein